MRTWITELLKDGVRVQFEIIKLKTGKLACDGHFLYTMIALKTGRAQVIPDWIVAKYSI